jgi:ketosteroid isomerase-like protein
MKATIIFIFTLILMQAHTIHAVAGSDPRAEITEVFSKTVQMFADKDLDGLVNRFVAEGSIKLPNTPLVKGHEALRAYYSGTLQLRDFTLSIEPFEMNFSSDGEVAWVLANFAVSFTTPGGPFSDGGVSLLVFQLVDGKWKIAAECLSSGSSN